MTPHHLLAVSPSVAALVSLWLASSPAAAAPFPEQGAAGTAAEVAAWPGTVGAYMCTAKRWGHPLNEYGQPSSGECKWIPIFGGECNRLVDTPFDRNISSFGPDQGLKCVLFETPDCSLHWPDHQPVQSSSQSAETSAKPVTLTASYHTVPPITTVYANSTFTTMPASVPIVTITVTATPSHSPVWTNSTSAHPTEHSTAEAPVHEHSVQPGSNPPAFLEIWWPGYADMGWNGWEDRVRSFRCFLE